MMQATVSTCGTSIFTNGTADELNKIDGLIAAKLDEAKQNTHYLIHTDTYQGVKAAELIQSWGNHSGIRMTPVKIDDLKTRSVEEFRLGVNNLIEWCGWTLPGYRSQGCRVIFNLVGGFKSLQGYMQTLGMFYADETVYIFETGGELLRIPRMSVKFSANTKQSVIENSLAFRRMQRGLYSSILPPVSDRIIITRKAQRTVPPNRAGDFNKAVDELSRYIYGGMRANLSGFNLRQLTGNPLPPSTHEFDLWGDRGGWRGFYHFEGDKLIIEDAGMGLDHH